MAIEYPAYGQLRVSNELKREGIMVSPGGVRSIWLRNDLNNLKKRLKALEIKMAQDGIVLTESQLQALERRKEDEEERMRRGEKRKKIELKMREKYLRSCITKLFPIPPISLCQAEQIL
jgi:gluconate kinase